MNKLRQFKYALSHIGYFECRGRYQLIFSKQLHLEGSCVRGSQRRVSAEHNHLPPVGEFMEEQVKYASGYYCAH